MAGRRWLGLACGVALLAAPAADARAQDGGPAVVVAGPQGDQPGTRLLARAHAGELCLELSENPSGGEYGGGVCASVPARDLYEPFFLTVTEPVGGAPRPLASRPPSRPRRAGGAVRAEVRTVEYELSGRRRAAFPTVAAPDALRGRRAGELRYFLGELPAGAQVYAIRLLGPDRELVAELDRSVFEALRPPAQPPFRIASGRYRGGRWSISATIEHWVLPLPGDVGHRERMLCLRDRRSERDGGGGMSIRCHEQPPHETSFDTATGCSSADAHVVYGVAPPGGVPRAAVLGDGRRVRVRRVALPRSFTVGGLTAWVAHTRRGAAVRSLILPGTRRRLVGLAPPALLPCGVSSVDSRDRPADGQPPSPGGDAQVAAPGAPALYVRDAGENELCIAPGRPAGRDECAAPGGWLGDALLSSDRAGRLVAGAVHPVIQAVRVTLSDGSSFDVRTHAGEGYTGRYAGRLAFYSAAAPAGRRVIAVDLLDARGRRLAPAGFIERRLAEDARTLIRGRGADGPYRVAVAALEAARRRELVTCLFVVRGPLPREGDRCPGHFLPAPQTLIGVVRCRPRAAVLVAGISARTGSVTAHLAGGQARRFAIRRTGSGDRVALLAVPPRAAVRAVAVRSRGGRLLARYATPVPPATAQCGYDFFLFAPPGG